MEKKEIERLEGELKRMVGHALSIEECHEFVLEVHRLSYQEGYVTAQREACDEIQKNYTPNERRGYEI